MEKIPSMEAFDAITTRRSIRQYTGEAIPGELLEQILNAGFCAPSAHNLRPWDFIVVRDKEHLSKIAENGKYTKMVRHCDAAVIVCGDTEKQANHDLIFNDCSAATQNILLAAHALGLGAVWCGVVQPEHIAFLRSDLNIPEHILPTALISIGYPNEERPAPERFDASRVHEESYQKA